MTAPLIYCAGPFASPEDRWQVLKLEDGLRSWGYRAYIPFRDGLDALYPGLPGNDDHNRYKLARSIFAFNVGRLVGECDAVLFCMNGRVPDEGGLVATALAAMIGIPVILYKQDHRSTFYGFDNAMIIGLSRSFSTVAGPGAAVKAVAREICRGKKSGRSHQLPPALADAVSLGRKLAESLADRLPLSPDHDAETIKKLLAVYDGVAWTGPWRDTGHPPAAAAAAIATGRPRGRVYCSGPLFCPGEVRVMADIARALETSGWGTYLPHRDGVEAFVMKRTNSYAANLIRPLVRLFHRLTFAVDVYHILQCDGLVFNLNGRVPDEGGVVEIGLAFAAGKPVVLYRESAAGADAEGLDPMIMAIGAQPAPAASVPQIPGLVGRIDMSGYRHDDLIKDSEGLPIYMRRMARLGQKAVGIMNRLAFFKPKRLF